jgi:hypothetical protein
LLHGLKQARNVWNDELNSVLEELGFTRLKTDYCCYVRRNGEDFTILLIWVDDFISISTEDEENNRTEKELQAHFEVKSLGQPSILLGIKLRQEDHIISLSQTHFINTLLEKFRSQDANTVNTLLDPHVKRDDIDEKGNLADKGGNNLMSHGYIICDANWISDVFQNLAHGTRPDIAYATHKLAQYTSNPKPKHRAIK